MTEAERDTLDIDVLFVGAGPASLSGALRLGQLVAEHNEAHPDELLEPTIAVLEKGKEVGSHAFSGAVFDRRALAELLPEGADDAPYEAAVGREQLLFLTAKRALSLPVPPPLRNRGKHVLSLGRLLKWLAPQVEAAGVDIFCEFPAAQILLDGERVVGVRTGDRGIDRDGERRSNFEPGIDILSKVVVLGEGPRGTLAKQLEQRFDLTAGRNPQVYALGIKELWQLPAGRLEPGFVMHTMGWPLDRGTFGGGFVYMMRDDLLIVGFVAGLDYRDPSFDPHREFQRFKTHPHLAGLLDGGEMVNYGAKAIPEGGWWAMPQLYGDGFVIAGDSGGLLNSQRLKGIHLAMKSGMLAAETVFDALKSDDTSASKLADYEQRLRSSWAGQELHKVRNFHQAFDHGLWAGMAQAGLGLVTGGRGWGVVDRLRSTPGHTRLRSRADAGAVNELRFDGTLTFDKLADVYNSGTAHEENQPSHLHVHDTELCVTECAEKYGSPCQHFCPANVYEIVDDSSARSGRRLQINASNCVHCKTCDIMDPYQIIDWVPPEGGGGPSYGKM